MRNPNPNIKPLIKEKALELLMNKNPEQIGMRDIANECKITATSIYHYYKDKDKLFQEISLDCLYQLNERIKAAANNASAGSSTTSPSSKAQIRKAISAFRDWCFENPRRALLVMQGIKSAEDATPEIIEEYYACNRTGEELLKKAVAANEAKSENPRLDVGLLVSGLWGCIESVLLKKADVEYWEKGVNFTDAFIELWINSIFVK